MTSRPTIIIKRLRFRHHLAFSYCASSIGASLFSRSCAIDVLLAGRTEPLPFSSVAGRGGRGSTAAANQALEKSVLSISHPKSDSIPNGNMNPIVNRMTCMFLRFGDLEIASWSMTGSMNRLLRFGTLARCCQRCGDQVLGILVLGTPLTSTRLISDGRTRVIGRESFLEWPIWSRGRVRGGWIPRISSEVSEAEGSSVCAAVFWSVA